MQNQRTGVSTFAIHTSFHADQKLQKSFHLSRQKKLFFKIPSLQNFLKPVRTTQDRTATQQFDNGTGKLIQTLQLDTEDRTAGHNSTLPKVAVSYFVGQFCRYINFSASYESLC